MILLIDNYDSFVHNLGRYMALAGWDYKVVRNDKITIQEIEKLQPEAIVLSPGPCTPKEAGICIDVIKQLGPTIPILGVCLGHQCIAEAFGGKTMRSPEPMHGAASDILHNYGPLFSDLPNPLSVGRYHSLVVDIENAPNLTAIAYSDDQNDIIMALEHKDFPIYGVQFHPESILTEKGLDLIRNFTTLALSWNDELQQRAGEKWA